MKLHIIELKKFSDFSAIRTAWDRMLEQAVTRNVALTYEWAYASWKRYAGFFDVRVATLWEADTLVSAIPFVARPVRGEGCRGTAVQVLTEIVPYSTVSEDAPVLECFFAYLRHNYADLLKVSFQEVDASCYGFAGLTDWAQGEGMPFFIYKSHESPYVEIRTDFSSYYLTRKKKIKNALRNKPDKLQALSPFRIESYAKETDIRHGFRQLLEIDCESWKYEERSDMASREGQHIFYETLAEEGAKRGMTELWLLVNEREPVAFEYNLFFEGKVMAIKWGYKAKYAAFSPGVILRLETTKQFFERGFRMIDLWGSKDQFKTIWSDAHFDRYAVHLYANSAEGLALKRQDEAARSSAAAPSAVELC
ncbi:GNAT family N-acetyltransferase [Paenibacillus oleatilyticus]|uniref:GNAT family N-acetyltransferase n=1 Tax=Paenibacillus oleatilyticus TaxID=2594886 RepID=UPI001C1FB67F|nr:GNAT family N-acetyltransferase [Paenibacillus oleatilyticus]MBU7315052.1 GNAT family N-acetyltransferase [Paenibacillus oleatilyticus]